MLEINIALVKFNYEIFFTFEIYEPWKKEQKPLPTSILNGYRQEVSPSAF